MDLVTGAMGNLAPKLYQLLQGEYELQKGVRKKLVFLHQELEGIKPALDKVAQVPWDRHHEQVKVWARQMREASYDIEDLLDTFLVRVQGSEPVDQSRLKRALKKMGGLFGKAKARRDISSAIEDIKKQLQEVADRRDRCKIDEIVAKPADTSAIDPRLEAMYKEVTQLIGIDKSRGELLSMLSSPQGNEVSHEKMKGNEVSHEKMKIVSVVGVGGLGKTTLAKAVYDELKSQFHCGAFVPVGRNPDMKKVLRDILIDLDKKEFREPKYDILDVRQLINELKDFLQSKRYFIVIDDVWDTRDWKNIGLALVENDRGSIVIKTTRKSEVATGVIYQLRPLSDDDSKMLLFTRLFDSGGERPANLPAEACEKIMKKCGGVPLAIITMASMLVGKKTEDWLAVCNSPGFYRGNDGQQAHDTEWILSLSYYDLPMHLKTCLLYLSVYPEDYCIEKDKLIWKWIAEGFVETKTGTSLFQLGEEYFNQLVNRSMIQAVRDEDQGGVIYACQVHDMVLDLIRGLSYEENFVTISNDDKVTSPSGNKVRRLAHQNRVMKQLTQQEDDTGMARVRSLVACWCDIGSWVLHPSFKLLRVLALEDCNCEKGWQGLKHLGDLLHLRYLGLQGTRGIYELPEEIGKLKFLQILDLDGSGIQVLPFGVCQLTQLVCLRGGFRTCAPDGLLKKLTSLEELRICIDNLNDESKRQFVKALGNLSELRVLSITGSLEGTVPSDLAEWDRYEAPLLAEWDRVVLSQHLQSLILESVVLRRLPSCINPARLPSLCNLDLFVEDIDEAGLRAVGGMPQLRRLELSTLRPSMASSTATVVIAGDGFFQKLRRCSFSSWMVQFVVNEDSACVSFSLWNGKQQGALAAFGSSTEDESSSRSVTPTVMPNLQDLRFRVPVRALYKDGNGSCRSLGLHCLPSLRGVTVYVDCEGASPDDVERAEAELWHAAQLHPNSLIPRLLKVNEGKMMRHSTDQLMLDLHLQRLNEDAPAMYKEVTQLIGIDKSRGELLSMLSSPRGNEVSHEKMKIVSVVGVGGLGKTTLAKAVYDELKSQFNCGAFVPVGRNPDMKKVLRDILIDLDKKEFREPKYDILDVRQLINELNDFLRSKRYFIVIDDVWETRDWENIELALVENDRGSIVIKTTRKSEVATGVNYQLRRLSDDDSKKLLYTRLFDTRLQKVASGECPANLPAEAFEKIMRKCGGVPLAIITMASMLVGKKTEDWLAVCNSPGFYRGNDGQQAHDTEWILSLSYYDLPMHLKTCLLYLSVYPEDYFIPKDLLIWKWIAEGFVEMKTGTSLFQLGEEYFNQLVNRSMIQAVRAEDGVGDIIACQVHDMVLDLIRGLSYEENFVTISNDDEVTSPSGNKVRRLAHQNRVMKQLTQQEDDTGMARVRSLVACRCDIKSWVLHPSFKLLRVLALENCNCEKGWQGLKHLGDLLHLRYLGLQGTRGIYELPEEIGKLKFLQTLDLFGSGIRVLPFGVCQLTQLVCLRAPVTRAPDGLLKKVTSLEELHICIDNLNHESKGQFVKALGNLSELRVLRVYGSLEGTVQSDLAQSLGNLHKLQHLSLFGYEAPLLAEWDRVVLSQHLQILVVNIVVLRRLPSRLPSLCYLELFVEDIDEAGLRAVGGLPQLRRLNLHRPRPYLSSSGSTATVVIAGDGFFQKLRHCSFSGWMVQFVVNEDSACVSFSLWKGKQQGALAAFGSSTEDESSSRSVPPTVMPNLQDLEFHVPVRALYKDGNDSCHSLGLHCLPSLRRVTVYVECEGASPDDVEKAEAELRHAAQLHPNSLMLDLHRWNEDQMMRHSTDQIGDQDGDDLCEEEEEEEGEVSSAGDEVIATELGADPTSA